MKPVVLCILDGLGIGRKTQGNPMREVPTPTFDWIKAHFPYFGLQASGIAVGLPWGDVGSSEIGHLTLGVGRIVYQNYPKITMAVRNGTFARNAVLAQTLAHVKNHASTLHLVGMVSRAKTHAALEHLDALLHAARQAGIGNVLIHAIGDGQDSLPQQGLEVLREAAGLCTRARIGMIASVSGRYYAMDTNQYWDRTERMVKLLTQGGKTSPEFAPVLQAAYKRGLTDAQIEPTTIGTGDEARERVIRENDAVLFFNFREDGMAQLSRAFCDPSFSRFARTIPANVVFSAFTQYGAVPESNVMFPRERIVNPLGKVLADHGKRVLKLTESMKEDLLTYHFNGSANQQFQNEHRIIIPSEKRVGATDVALQGETVVTRLFQAMDERVYDCIVVNLPQLDVAGHQTDYGKGKEAVTYVDALLNRIAKATLDLDVALLVTSDHGNIEQMFDPASGQPDTHHNDNPVPFMLVGKQWYKDKTEREVLLGDREVRGSLADVAPTVLDILSLPVPKEMSGQSLLHGIA